MAESERIALALFLGLAWLLLTVRTHWRERVSVALAAREGVTEKLVVYASQTGTAQALASEYARRYNLPPPLALAQLTPDTLTQVSELHCFVSTYGDGESPDNGRKFARALQNSNTRLPELTFSVTALGDSRYPDFCAFGHLLYNRLQSCGATPLAAVNCIDASETNNVDDSHFSEAVLLSREHLNPHSAAPGLYALTLSVPDSHWQAGGWLDVCVPNPDNPSAYLLPRTYSVASAGQSETLRLIVRHHVRPDGQKGLASDYLTHTLAEGGKVRVHVRENPAMTLTDSDAPLLLIGAGSGLAGLLGVIETQALGATHRPIWLIYGERDPQFDRPYADMLDTWQESGVITRLDRVFSRPTSPAAPSLRYCQEVLINHPDAVKDFLGDAGHILVCGSLKGMGSAVDEALRHVLGEQQIEAMTQQGGYHRDLY